MDVEEKKLGGSTSKRHSRVVSYNRARRATQGPLEIDDPLAVQVSSPSVDLPKDVNLINTMTSPSTPYPLSPSAPLLSMEYPNKDFSYLLRPEIYHPLTQLDTPQAFRNSPLNPSNSTPLADLLSAGHFRPAAIATVQQLTTSVSPTDYARIFSLFYTRLACLTIINATPLAAQEVKALEDLSSSFYRHPISNTHLVPWELRVLAVRLQGIGYADARRGIMGYYDLARDVRTEISKTKIKAERDVWKARLQDLGLRVANALAEMGDLEGAGRHLESLKQGKTDSDYNQLLGGRLALLYLRIGNVAAAKSYINSLDASKTPYVTVLEPLLALASGSYSNAVTQFTSLEPPSFPTSALFTQNLAVCLLYSGEISKARSLLEELISSGHSFHALTFNLSTIYELCTDRSRVLKGELAEKVAEGEGREDGTGWERVNEDFKL